MRRRSECIVVCQAFGALFFRVFRVFRVCGIDQFSPIDVFNFQTHEIIDNFTLSIFSKR